MLIGGIRLLHFILAVVAFIQRHSISRSKGDLLKKYGGQGSWAVVTGASDGIGAEYCRQLAAEGFNVFLVSRTLSKLNSVRDELKKINGSAKTEIV